MKQLLFVICVSMPINAVASEDKNCSPEAVKAVSASCEEVDHTGIMKDAVAKCTARIEASEGFFFLAKDVSVYFGSTYEGIRDRTKPSGRQKLTTVPFSGDLGVPNSPIIKNLNVLSSVTASGYCDRAAGPRLGRTCYAKAKLTAKAYPLSCLKHWLGL